MVRLERHGIATAAVATEPFIDEALEQARMLGMPEYRMVFIPHPVQLLSQDEVRARADEVFVQIAARLTQSSAAR
jgi:uracil-DNA glycosylase